MPVPRRFDRRPPERDTTRINERIRVPEVRLIDDEGNQIGVMKTPDALAFAQERELDLVEVAPEARPPVARVLDYSKYKYEQAQKLKQARKHQQQITIREIKFRPKIAQHDYDTKKHHVERFLRHKDKVKVTIMFRGREVTHPERGTAILDRLAEELSELGVVEQRPMQEGRNMTMMMAPSKAVLAGRVEVHESPDGEARQAAHVGDVASAAIESPAGANGTGKDAVRDESGLSAEAEPVSDGEPSAAPEPTAEAEPVSDGEPSAALEPTAEAAPVSDGEPSAAPEPTAEAEPVSDGEPSAALEPTAEAEPPSGAEPTAEAEPAGEPEPTAKAEAASE